MKKLLEDAMNDYNQLSPYNMRLEAHSQLVNLEDSFNFTNAVCSHLSNNVVAIIGISSKTLLATTKAFSTSLKVPFILLNSPADPLDPQSVSKFLFFMKPSPSRAIADVVQTYHWDDMHYFYYTNEGLTRLEQVFDHFHRQKISPDISVMHVTSANDTFNTLKQIHMENKSRDIRLVLDLSSDDAAEVILRLRDAEDILKIRFHFIVPLMDLKTLNLTQFKIGGVNITGFELDRSSMSSPFKIDKAFAKDAVLVLTKSLEEILKEIGSIRLFKKVSRWRGINRLYFETTPKCGTSQNWVKEHGERLAKKISTLEFNGDSGKVAFNGRNGQRKEFQLNVLEVTMYLGAANVGLWNDNGFQPQRPTLILDKANRTIDNRTRIVISIEEAPYMTRRKTTEHGYPVVGVERYLGFCAELANKVALNVGYEYHLRMVWDSEYGKTNKDGTWNGMIGELIRHDADIAVAPLTITSDREKVLDFTKPFMSLGISIMFKKPEDQEPHVFSFMEPLSQEIWLCTAFAFIGVSVVLFLVSRFSSVEWQLDGPEHKLTNVFTIGNSLWFSLGAFMQQGCDVLPKSVSGRIVTSVWWFFTLIVISSYTANLAAYLTNLRMTSPISSAEDLAKQTEIKYGVRKGGSTYMFFNGSTVSLYQRMMSFMGSQPSVFVESNEEGIRRVRDPKEKYAFLIESTTNEFYNSREPCDTMQIGNNLDSKGYGIATPMGSEIRDMLTLATLELREHGILEAMRKKWWHPKKACPEPKKLSDKTDNSLTLTKVAGIFYILIVGLGLSVIAAILEFLYKTRVDSRKQNKTFRSEARSKFRLSISGHSDDESMGVRTPLKIGATFSYTNVETRTGKTQTIV
ncbi:glutamate receptor-like isoform X2 [Gigantopelta aegis]|nr:glutamate receptor-like isoform X2 [Gigantopelta aegis]